MFRVLSEDLHCEEQGSDNGIKHLESNMKIGGAQTSHNGQG